MVGWVFVTGELLYKITFVSAITELQLHLRHFALTTCATT